MRVLLTGGTGFLGRATIRALLAAGHGVRLLTRDAGRAAALGELSVDVMEGDPADQATVAATLDGCDAAVHAAATFSYARGDEVDMLEGNPRLARAVLGAARTAGIKVVDVSSVVVFSLLSNRMDERTPLAAEGEPGWGDPYLRSKVLAERVGRDLERQGLARVTLHPGGIVGPDDRGPGPSGTILVRLLQDGPMPAGRLSWVDVRDVARAIVAALDAQPGSRFVVAVGAVAFADLGGRLDALTGRHVRRFFLPPAATRLGARLNDAVGGRLVPLPPAGSLDVLLQSPPVIDGGRSAELGVDYRPLDETLADAVRWWAANGVIAPRLAGQLAGG